MVHQEAAADIKPPYVYAALLIVLGLGLASGGFYLLALGGSGYYAISGLTLVLSGWLIGRRDELGAWIFAVFLFVTILWALYESGRDPWALMPRLLGPLMLGAWLFMPWTRRRLRWKRQSRFRSSSALDTKACTPRRVSPRQLAIPDRPVFSVGAAAPLILRGAY